MWNLIKSMFRYSFKNKGSFFGLFFLIYIAIATFTCFGTLNSNLSDIYNTLTQEYNMHNVVINELYDSPNYDIKQSHFRTWLASQPDFQYRTFDALDVSTNKDSYKLINYSNQYTIDMLDTFQNPSSTKWIMDSVFHPYSLNDIVYLSQINQASLSDVIETQSMADFVKSDYINTHQDWYNTNGAASLPTNDKLWFGMYQDENQDLVIDGFVIDTTNDSVVGFRPKMIVINKKNFKDFSFLTLNDYSNNYSWRYNPEETYTGVGQKYLEKITINTIANNNLKNVTNDKLNLIQYNTNQEIDDYINSSANNNLVEVGVNQLPNFNDINNVSSITVLNYLLDNYQNLNFIKVLPSKDFYEPSIVVCNYVDFLFQTKNNSKLTTYIIKNVNKYKPLINRQLLFSFASNTSWSSNQNDITSNFKSAESFVKNNPIFDYAWLINNDLSTKFQNTPLWNGLTTENVNISDSSYLIKGVKSWVNNSGLGVNGVNLLINKYKIVFDLSSGVTPISGIFTDPTSYAAIVSPTWLEKNNKSIFPKEEWVKFVNRSKDGVAFETIIKDIPDKYKINISSTSYLILSTGITPDFMYPVISFENMIPNPVNQAIVYVGDTGYERCFEAYQNNPQEKMLLGKYVGNNSLYGFINDLNSKIVKQNFMSWPQGTDAVYSYDSKNNKITPATLRVSFTSSLITTINAFSIAISAFIGLIALFVVTILIRQFVVKNRSTLGIMNANGYSKTKVIYALSTLGLIPAFIGGLVGYMVGFFTNTYALGLFKSYWLLPLNKGMFNIPFFFISILIPIILFIGITLLIGAISLRGSATTLLSKTQTIKVGIIAKVVNKKITKTPIMLRFRTSIVFSTFYRLLVLSFMTSLVVVSAEFMASSLNSFSTTDKISARETDYKFSVDLFTPTNEGGEYYGLKYNDLGKPFLNPNGSQGLDTGSYSSIFKNNPYMREYSNLHYPGIDDNSQQFSELDYLKFKTQVRELINFKIVSTNPWEFAQNMMPPNTSNQAINSTKTINQNLMSDNRLLSLVTFLNVTESPINFSTNWPKNLSNKNYFDELTLGNIINNGSHINTPGLSLVDENNKPKTIHIINFNGAKELNFDKNDELCIDINSLMSMDKNWLGDNSISAFLSQNKETLKSSIIEKVNQYYVVFDTVFKLKGLFKTDAVNYFDIKKSDTNPNVIDIVFDDYATGDDVFEVKNVLTNRNLFTGFFYGVVDNDSATLEELQTSNNVFMDPFSTLENPIFYKAINSSMVGISLKSPFISYVLNYFNDPIFSEQIFRICYGLIGMNGDDKEFNDEPYVYVDGMINELNGENVANIPLTKYLVSNDIQLVGILENSKYINLLDENNNSLNAKLSNWDVNSKNIPIIINEFAAKKYGLKIGDNFKIKPDNTVDRYGVQLYPGYISEIAEQAKKYTLNVVGISQSFHNSYAYIPINAARKLIGLSIPNQTNANNELAPYYTSFNGIFSSSNNPYLLTNSLSLYSPSGLYPGVNTWEPLSSQGIQLLKKAVSAQKGDVNYDLLNKALGSSYYSSSQQDIIAKMKEDVSDNVDLLVQNIAKKLTSSYGATSYQSIVMNAMAIDNSNALYSSLSETVISLGATVLTLIFIIALIVVLIMLWMILMDLMPLLALLSTMGMTIWSNSLTFMCILIPTWFISAFISGPIVWALLNVFKEFVFSGIGILLIAPFNLWAYVLILLLIGGIFGLAFVLGAKKLSNVNIANAIKR